jgi:hypothetical protein
VEHAEVVHRFLESVGRRGDADFYLALFRAIEKERFAAIVLDADVAREAREAVVHDLRVLATLSLSPVVLLGLFEPATAADAAARLERRLARVRVPAVKFATAPGDDGGVASHAARVAEAARSGTIPIVPVTDAPAHESSSSSSSPPAPGSRAAALGARFERAGALLASLGTRKLIFLRRAGGLKQHGALVPLVNLTTEYAELAASRELAHKERTLLAQARRLVFELVPQPLLVSVTSPLDLFRELFTVKGAGTLMRRGAVIQRHTGFSALDVARLRALLTSSFGRPPRDDFFARPVSRVLLEEGYRGAAIVAHTPLGVEYLSKFAVEREAQGEGIGRDLWDALTADCRTFFWRARAQNPIGEWYARVCDGLVRTPAWHVYWKGLTVERVPEAVGYALAQPEDLPLG